MSKSDQKLAQELAATGIKTNITLAEAQAEAATGKLTRVNDAPSTKTEPDTGKPSAKTKTTRGPRVSIAPGSKPSQVLAAHITDPNTLYDTARLVKLDEANEGAFKVLATKIDTLAKKVGEKAVNLLRNRGNPAGVQVYTRMAMDKLIAQGTATSKDLVEMYRAVPYKEGTARAQANQIMQLLPALSVASREDRGTLKLNKDSVIVMQYRKAMK